MKGVTKPMNKKLKKGFTLAELLIVVAIIAVLTAIAVPLFVTSINKAQNATKDANIRSVRVAAVYYILSHDEDPNLYADNKLIGDKFQVDATLDTSGNISDLKVAVTEKDVTEKYDTSTEGKIVICTSVTATQVESQQKFGAGG